jgi:mycothiol synthase
MSTVHLSNLTAADSEVLQDLLTDPGIMSEYAPLIETGEFRSPLGHPCLHPGGFWLAWQDGQAVGFGMLLVMQSAHGPWAFLRIGVRAAHRRRGIGSMLLAEAERALAALPRDQALIGLAVSAWLTTPEAEPFLESRGFSHFRFWWNMERPIGPVEAVSWPADLDLLPFDGSDHALREWTDCYNDSFAARFPSHIGSVEETRELTTRPFFRADGCLLVWKELRCVGFCRCSLQKDHGEIDVLAVRPEAQGAGLGRTLLRWGIAWLQAHDAPRVRLLVDGDNEQALRLYRSEGFDVAATRRMWMKELSRG